MRKYLFVGLTLVLSTFFLFWKLTPAKKEAPDNSDMEGIVEQLREEMQRNDIELKRMMGYEMANLKRAVQANQHGRVSCSEKEIDDSPEQFDTESQLTPEEKTKKEYEAFVMENAQMAERIDSAMEHDTRATLWGADSEARIVSGFKDYGIEGSTIRDVECSDSLCKVEIQHELKENLVSVVDKVLSNPPIEISSAFVPEPPDGLDSEVTVVYYSRKDTETVFAR